MKNKNAGRASVSNCFGLITALAFTVSAIVLFTVCVNPVIDRWWADGQPTSGDRLFHVVNFNMEGGMVEDGTPGGGMVEAQLIAHNGRIAKVPGITREHYGFSGGLPTQAFPVKHGILMTDR